MPPPKHSELPPRPSGTFNMSGSSRRPGAVDASVTSSSNSFAFQLSPTAAQLRQVKQDFADGRISFEEKSDLKDTILREVNEASTMLSTSCVLCAVKVVVNTQQHPNRVSPHRSKPLLLDLRIRSVVPSCPSPVPPVPPNDPSCILSLLRCRRSFRRCHRDGQHDMDRQCSHPHGNTAKAGSGVFQGGSHQRDSEGLIEK